jgi:hypothetical protein
MDEPSGKNDSPYRLRQAKPLVCKGHGKGIFIKSSVTCAFFSEQAQ